MLLSFAAGHISSPSDLQVVIGVVEAIIAVAVIISIIYTIIKSQLECTKKPVTTNSRD
jgi:hypothetical protein